MAVGLSAAAHCCDGFLFLRQCVYMHHGNEVDNLFRLGCEINTNGIIVLTVAGRMTKDRKNEFADWVARVKQTVLERAALRPDRVLLLSNVANVGHFERELLDGLKELFDYDRRYVTKSAIVGAPPYLALLIDAVAKLTGRTNVQQFATDAEAFLWLDEPKNDVPGIGVNDKA